MWVLSKFGSKHLMYVQRNYGRRTATRGALVSVAKAALNFQSLIQDGTRVAQKSGTPKIWPCSAHHNII